MNKQLQIVLGSFMILLVLFPLIAHWDENDSHANLANYNYGKNLFNTLEYNSIFLTEGGDNQVFASAYNQMAGFIRPDVRIYDQKGNVFYRIYGDFRHMSRKEINIKRYAVDFELYNRNRPVYLTWKRNPPVGTCGDFYEKRYGMLYKITPLKYRIVDELEAMVEMSFNKVHTFIKNLYKNSYIMKILKKNSTEIDWYIKFLATGRVYFINAEARQRIMRATVEYQKFVTKALSRKIDKKFVLKILAVLEKEGLLKRVGSKVVFVKNRLAPFNLNYWKNYSFDYIKTSNAVDWDYLTREIFTNYNFNYAKYLGERIAMFKNQLAFWIKKRNVVKVKDLRKKIKSLQDEQMAAYKKAGYYGFDMVGIHHNLGVIYSQKGMTKKAMISFGKGAKTNPYSFATIYSYLILALQDASKSGDAKIEKEKLKELKSICYATYKRMKSKWKKKYKKNPHYRRINNIEKYIIEPRLRKGLKYVNHAKALYKANLKNKRLHNIYLNNYLNVLNQRRSYDELIRVFRAASNLKWDDPKLILLYGLALENKRQYKLVVKVYTKVAEKFPGFYISAYRLASVYQRAGDVKNAIKYYEQVVNAADNNLVKYFGKNAKRYQRNFIATKRNAATQIARLKK